MPVRFAFAPSPTREVLPHLTRQFFLRGADRGRLILAGMLLTAGRRECHESRDASEVKTTHLKRTAYLYIRSQRCARCS